MQTHYRETVNNPLPIRDKPLASLADYEIFAKVCMRANAYMLRQAVRLIRDGMSKSEVGRIHGVDRSTISRWLAILPEELRP